MHMHTRHIKCTGRRVNRQRSSDWTLQMWRRCTDSRWDKQEGHVMQLGSLPVALVHILVWCWRKCRPADSVTSWYHELIVIYFRLVSKLAYSYPLCAFSLYCSYSHTDTSSNPFYCSSPYIRTCRGRLSKVWPTGKVCSYVVPRSQTTFAPMRGLCRTPRN